jgi:cation diffusion facilitator CzcD-associated flavoprotein CzcO
MSVSVTVIVGAGQAGSELAWSLRQQGYSGRIVLVVGPIRPEAADGGALGGV